jgi:hypothetical protein
MEVVVGDVLLGTVWVLASALLGFGVAAVFAGVLKLPRSIFLIIYVPVTALFFAVFVAAEEIDLARVFTHNWVWGLVGAAVCGFIVIRNVLAQRPSERRTGGGLVVDVLWPGLAYGVIDALLLSVIPILAVFGALSGAPWAASPAGKVGVGAIALAASAFVAAAYHLGYPEFRGRRVLWAVFGNIVISLAYLLTTNPLAAILSHAAMHIVAMVHGRETTVQLPPHYGFAPGEGMAFQKRAES